MEKIKFTDPDTAEETEFFVIEETKVNGTQYLFVAEEEEGDCDAYILKQIALENEEIVYEMADEEETAAIGKIFAELIEDADIEY